MRREMHHDPTISFISRRSSSIGLCNPLAGLSLSSIGGAALAAGGSEADDAEEQGFMYSRSFFDLDGHGWQAMWINPASAEQGPEAFAASMQDTHAPV